MSSPTVVENPLRQTKLNNKKPNGLKTRSWKNFGKTFLPAFGNNEVGQVGKKSRGLFGRFGTNKITGPNNTTIKASNEISANIITNARTTNYDLIRRLWRQYKEKSNEIDFIPRIDTLEKIGKFELELECFKNKNNAHNLSGRDSIIARFIYLGYSTEEANNMLCNYTSQSIPNELKQRLIALKLPIDPTSTIIDTAVNTLTLPDELQKEKMKIVTNLIILRLILSDQLIVRLKSNNEKVVETSFGNLTTFGQVLKVASFLTFGVSIFFFVPGVLINEFPEEFMFFSNRLELANKDIGVLNNYMKNFYKARYQTNNTDVEFTEFAYTNDKDASIYFIDKIKNFIIDNNRLPTPDEEQAIILETNNKYKFYSSFYVILDKKGKPTYEGIDWKNELWDYNLKDKNSFAYKLLKILGIQGSITGIKSVIIGATSWSAVGGAVLIRKLHGLLKQYLSETAKNDISDFIDRFLFNFPVAINLIRNPKYIESFSDDTTLNLQIQRYIADIIFYLDEERREQLSNDERLAENAEIAEKLAKAEKNAEDAKKKAKAEIEMFQDSIINTNTTTNETATKGNNKTVWKNTWPNAISFANFTKPANANANPKGGRRSYRQKRRSSTKRRKTHRKN